MPLRRRRCEGVGCSAAGATAARRRRAKHAEGRVPAAGVYQASIHSRSPSPDAVGCPSCAGRGARGAGCTRTTPPQAGCAPRSSSCRRRRRLGPSIRAARRCATGARAPRTCAGRPAVGVDDRAGRTAAPGGHLPGVDDQVEAALGCSPQAGGAPKCYRCTTAGPGLSRRSGAETVRDLRQLASAAVSGSYSGSKVFGSPEAISMARSSSCSDWCSGAVCWPMASQSSPLERFSVSPRSSWSVSIAMPEQQGDHEE
jgi:hypothetical protein